MHPQPPQHPQLQTASQLLRSIQDRDRRPPLPIHVPAFDRLQGGGLTRGSLVELAGTRSSGRFALMLAALAAATTAGEATALVDLGDHLDPKAAQAAGVDLTRLLWMRPLSVKDALTAAEMVLSAGFGLVVLDLGAKPLPLHRVPEAAWMRLARAAEAQKSILLLISPYSLRSSAAGAVIVADKAQALWEGEAPSPRLLSGISVRLTAVKQKQPLAVPTDSEGTWALNVAEGIG
jgi:hypothetical protein